MKFKELLTNYIDSFKDNEPILIEEIKEYFKGVVLQREYKNTLNKIYVYLSRMINKGELNVFIKGVYYRGCISKEQIIEKRYIKDDKGIKGYISGDSLLCELGLVSKKKELVTITSNVCIKGSRYVNNTLGVIVVKPVINIDSNNYKYLQLFELIKMNLEEKVIENFIKNNSLSYKKIFEYFRESNFIKNKKS